MKNSDYYKGVIFGFLLGCFLVLFVVFMVIPVPKFVDTSIKYSTPKQSCVVQESICIPSIRLKCSINPND